MILGPRTMGANGVDSSLGLKAWESEKPKKSSASTQEALKGQIFPSSACCSFLVLNRLHNSKPTMGRVVYFNESHDTNTSLIQKHHHRHLEISHSLGIPWPFRPTHKIKCQRNSVLWSTMMINKTCYKSSDENFDRRIAYKKDKSISRESLYANKNKTLSFHDMSWHSQPAPRQLAHQLW